MNKDDYQNLQNRISNMENEYNKLALDGSKPQDNKKAYKIKEIEAEQIAEAGTAFDSGHLKD
ncbi:MAG: hypothetical protein E7637_01280 [Ruminococcaceae bacterium]|nr:hypothetical protein [Oscillospiraceae bacterium]